METTRIATTQPGRLRRPPRPPQEVDPDLKPERVQKELAAALALAGEPLKAATVQERLRQEYAQESSRPCRAGG